MNAAAARTPLCLLAATAVGWAVAALGCTGSAIGPPAGFVAEVVAGDLGAPDDGGGAGDAGAEAGGTRCQGDEECQGRFALYPCQAAVCQQGECVGIALPDGAACDDEDPCTAGDVCDDGLCLASEPTACSDDNPCTDDLCDPASGCVFPFNTAFCSDGYPCTIGDSCKEGACSGVTTSDCWSGDCCAAGATPGCETAALRECVCQVMPACCALDGAWTQACADAVEAQGCGICPAKTCGDGTCAPTEACATCPGDCGFCPACGDGACGEAETCFSCAPDCGPCATPICGDKVCVASEDCASCQVDCGACTGAVCGDGTCDLTESCQSCGPDCGACPVGCGDGVCTTSESCSACPLDCGVCVGSCCTESAGPGCDQALIEACVCQGDDYCCTEQWDGVCVAQVDVVGCARCDAVVCGDGVCDGQEEDCAKCEADCGACPFCGDGTCDPSEGCSGCEEDCGTCASQCCTPSDAPGCGDPAVEACVCANDSFCCSSTWDSLCVGEVEDYGCGNCGGSTGGCGDGTCGGGETCASCPGDCGPCGSGGDCCATSAQSGCSDPTIEDCVCAYDFLCCIFEWDSFCVSEVEEYGCGTCN